MQLLHDLHPKLLHFSMTSRIASHERNIVVYCGGPSRSKVDIIISLLDIMISA